MNYSEEAEQSVLGGLLIKNQAWELVGDKLVAEDFFFPENRAMFSEIKEMLNQNLAVDALILSDNRQRKGLANEMYPFELSHATYSIANIEHYASIVKKYSLQRQLIGAGKQISAIAADGGDDALQEAQGIIMGIGEESKSAPTNTTDILRNVIDDLQARYENKSLSGLTSGYSALDDMLHGFQKSDLIVLAARPGMGKTTFAMNIAEHVAIDLHQAVLMFSLEMSKEQLMQRLIASCGRVNFEVIRKAQLESDDFNLKVPLAVKRLSTSKLLIDDSPTLTVSDIRTRALRARRQHGLSLIIVDYLQLLHTAGKVENETIRITHISAALKRLAKELQVPVIALSQLNRSVEQRADKRPLMADLRQSGAIEQDADVILFLYREEVYEPGKNKGLAEVIIAKHRNGETGNANLIFEGRYCRFDNFDGRPISLTESRGWKHGFVA
jgi:replicative DNA helicase